MLEKMYLTCYALNVRLHELCDVLIFYSLVAKPNNELLIKKQTINLNVMIQIRRLGLTIKGMTTPNLKLV